MKFFPTLLLFAVLFCSASVFAQKNTLQLGLLYFPTNESAVAHGSLGYYRQLAGKHSVGLKAMFSTDAIGMQGNQNHFYIANVDVVHRWVLKKEAKRSKWNLEAGISAIMIYQKFPPVDSWSYCPVGATDEQMRAAQKYYEEVLSKWHTEREVNPGFATAASWEFALSQHFALGIGASANLYYSPKDGLCFSPVPKLNAAYSF